MTAPLRFSFTVEGELVVDRFLAGLQDRISNPSPAWPAVVAEFRRIVGMAFSTEGGSTGLTWPALAKSTQQERRRLGYGPAHPILQRTGVLRRALVEGDGAHVATSATSMRIIIGGEAGRIFTFHQSTRPRRKLPRRPPVLLTADDRTDIMHPVRLYVTGHTPAARGAAR